MKKFALLGHEISYSLSPLIHKSIYEFFGIDAQYELISCAYSELAATAAKLSSYDGYNVTKPYKNDIKQFLAEIKSKSSVNTVVNSVGYSTDGLGFVSALTHNGIEYRGKNIVIIGAGGVAHSIISAVKDAAKSVTILNRSIENAKKLQFVCGINGYNGQMCDIVVNCATRGGEGFLEGINFAENAFAFDTNYADKTFVSAAAERLGSSNVASGLSMLIFQAIESAKIMLKLGKFDENELYTFVSKRLL